MVYPAVGSGEAAKASTLNAPEGAGQMNEPNSASSQSDEPILITKEEATSRHVDDLIKRQMSLRGEGVTAEPARRWYYRNWLLFMIVGAVFAAGGWMIIEPWFDDYLYTQGVLDSVNTEEVLKPGQDSGFRKEIEFAGFGSVIVRGQKIWIHPLIREVENGRVAEGSDLADLKQGQEVGLYTKYYAGGREDIAIAHYIDLHPATAAHGKALVPLRDQERSSNIAGFLIFSVIAAMIGLGIGAADGIVCRLPRRAELGGVIGLLVGAVGALFTSVVAGVIYNPLSDIAAIQMVSDSSARRAFGFLLQMIGRMLSWAFAGMAMGLGQGIALRSKRLLVYGFVGGMIGGMLGGMLFDPLDTIILGADRVGADASRAIGLIVIGCAVGTMIGIVELLSRDAWLRMIEGPLAGKEFLLFRDTMNIGASPKSEIYLFNDPAVAPTHATLRVIGDEIEITARDRVHPLMVNQNSVSNARLRHGDRITIGTTSFLFEQRQR
jgi:hypothetical protein